MREKVNMTADETETVINYCKHHIGDWAEVYTTDKAIMRRYEKFAEKHCDLCKLIKEDKYSMTFSVHPKCAGVYPRAPRSTNMTEEQRQALADRLKNARMQKSE